MTAVTVWLLPLKELLPYYHRLHGLLSNAEQARAARYKVTTARESFVLRRGCLRLILAAQLQQSPASLHIESAACGKLWCARWHFNISHSRDYAVIASSPDTAVGVDIEFMNPLLDVWTVAHYFLCEEQQHLRQCPPSEQRVQFFRYWTRKEAWAKLDGRRALQNWLAMYIPDTVQHHEQIIASHIVQCMANQPCRFTLTNIMETNIMKDCPDE